MGVVERRTGARALVDTHQHPRRAARRWPPATRSRQAVATASRTVRAQLRKPRDVGGPVHDHLLAVERRILVGHHPHRHPASRAAPPGGRPRASVSGGVIASWPSHSGQVLASLVRVVRPAAPGRDARPGAITTGTPVSGFRRGACRDPTQATVTEVTSAELCGPPATTSRPSRRRRCTGPRRRPRASPSARRGRRARAR